jgi:hypothetical protein
MFVHSRRVRPVRGPHLPNVRPSRGLSGLMLSGGQLGANTPKWHEPMTQHFHDFRCLHCFAFLTLPCLQHSWATSTIPLWPLIEGGLGTLVLTAHPSRSPWSPVKPQRFGGSAPSTSRTPPSTSTACCVKPTTPDVGHIMFRGKWCPMTLC